VLHSKNSEIFVLISVFGKLNVPFLNLIKLTRYNLKPSELCRASNSFRDTALQKLGIFSKKLKSFVYVSYFVKYHPK
jgi:hypothetical protein